MRKNQIIENMFLKCSNFEIQFLLWKCLQIDVFDI
jgi:hypothetical protein